LWENMSWDYTKQLKNKWGIVIRGWENPCPMSLDV